MVKGSWVKIGIPSEYVMDGMDPAITAHGKLVSLG